MDHIVIAAADGSLHIESGRLLGSVGSGGVALALTGVLITGIREPKGGGGKTSKIRKRLTSDQAQWTGVAAGTCYITAGSIWTASGSVSDAFARLFTSGAFGTVGLGAVSALLAGLMYFRELAPARAAVTGIIAAGVWAQAGGIWGLPEALVLTGAHAAGVM
ncbi:hypothetical protein FRZ00_05990 [Streptomyces mobaraensis]|uniref:Uncharacterized protein n=1 Tax=Streptomyces mobaraensis TaxID=35621 RepID=A0A5N5WEY9_STRMB|nr:hypothetical protein FRZ00_05990 [Streptomyces mobaraensis]